MDKIEMLTKYEQTTGAETNIFGFVDCGRLYMIETATINPDWIKLDRESSKKGGSKKIRLSFNSDIRFQLIRKGAKLVGPAEMLEGGKNRGDRFEQIIAEMFGIEWTGHNSKKYTEGGDLVINGKETQVKLETATIITEKTLLGLA